MIDFDKFKGHESVIGKLPLIPLELNSAFAKNVGEYVEYRGLRLRWSGFLAVPDSEKIICRWFCYFRLPTDDASYEVIGLLAMNTGHTQFYRQGEKFNLVVKEGFTRYCYIENLLTWPEDIQGAKQITLDNLKKAIDENWDIIRLEIDK